MTEDEATLNTDRELWRERDGDYYADSLFVTSAGGVGFNCGGNCIVKPIRVWHESDSTIAALRKRVGELSGSLKEVSDDLEAEVRARYASMANYPDQMRKMERDLAPVYSARAKLSEGEGEKGDG